PMQDRFGRNGHHLIPCRRKTLWEKKPVRGYSVPILAVAAHHEFPTAIFSRPTVNVPQIVRHIFGQNAGTSVHNTDIEIIGIEDAGRVGTRLTSIIERRLAPDRPWHDAGITPVFEVGTRRAHKRIVTAGRSAIDVGSLLHGHFVIVNKEMTP